MLAPTIQLILVALTRETLIKRLNQLFPRELLKPAWRRTLLFRSRKARRKLLCPRLRLRDLSLRNPYPQSLKTWIFRILFLLKSLSRESLISLTETVYQALLHSTNIAVLIRTLESPRLDSAFLILMIKILTKWMKHRVPCFLPLSTNSWAAHHTWPLAMRSQQSKRTKRLADSLSAQVRTPEEDASKMLFQPSEFLIIFLTMRTTTDSLTLRMHSRGETSMGRHLMVNL